jgi:hypothetical protein
LHFPTTVDKEIQLSFIALKVSTSSTNEILCEVDQRRYYSVKEERGMEIFRKDKKNSFDATPHGSISGFRQPSFIAIGTILCRCSISKMKSRTAESLSGMR